MATESGRRAGVFRAWVGRSLVIRLFFFSSRRRHTRFDCDWSSDVCSSDLGFSFGDWLAFATTRSDYPGATTDKDLIQTAYFARSTALLAKTAAVLGKKGDEIGRASCRERV